MFGVTDRIKTTKNILSSDKNGHNCAILLSLTPLRGSLVIWKKALSLFLTANTHCTNTAARNKMHKININSAKVNDPASVGLVLLIEISVNTHNNTNE